MNLRIRASWKAILAALALSATPVFASSHMDAPLITLDDAANTTDVYAFVSEAGGTQYLTTAVAVYPFEEPGIGPNKYNFDNKVLYEVHVSTGDDVAAGRKTLSYQFRFATGFRNKDTILQSYLGEVMNVADENQNLIQIYSVKRVDRSSGVVTNLGEGQTLIVPPNNQGRVTRFYNVDDDGDMPARGGVDDPSQLDRYTQQSIFNLMEGHQVFAGQREDGFFADIQSIFDLDFAFSGPNKPFDSQGGYNVHMIAVNIPLDAIGGPDQVVGVHATTSRPRVKIRRRFGDPIEYGIMTQVGRQGNPLFNEALVAIRDKDLYSRTPAERDADLFAKYALEPELAKVLIPLLGLPSNRTTNRTDLAGIFIPDVIKVDLSTGPARLAGDPDDSGFSRLSVFGGDALTSSVQSGLPGFPAGTIPGGFPNGRRFGDDVVDIAVTAVISDLRTAPLQIAGPAGDNVDANDATYNKVFPYAGTPLNGRNHSHH